MRLGRYARIGIGIAAVGVLGVGAAAIAGGNQRKFSERLEGYQEVPALSTDGSGSFRASLNSDGTELNYRLSFDGFASDVLFAHIHFENRTNNGPVIVFLCGGGGKPACPVDGGTVTGTIVAADVGAGAAGQGIAAGEFDEFVDALRSGATYVNVHTVDRPTGEIRAQIEGDRGND